MLETTDNPISKEIMKYLPSSSKEELLDKDNTNVENFINMLATSTDYKWIEKLINELSNNQITFERTSKNLQKNFVFLATRLQEEQVVTLINKLEESTTNIITQRTLLYLLENLNFSEATVKSLFPIYKKYGLIFNVKKYAKENDFEI